MSHFRACPVCGQTDPEPLYHFSYIPSNTEREVESKGRVDIVCCICCGFVYKDREDHYLRLDDEGKGKNRYEAFEHEGTKAYLELEARVIGQFFPRDAVLLDVGCSTGYLLSCLSGMGYSHLTGLELSKASCNKVENMGIRAVNASMCDDIAGFEQKFDGIILSHVLEHIPDLSRGMCQLTKWMKPGASLFVALPDEAHCHETYGSVASLLCVEHVNHFSLDTLNRLMASSGLEKVFSQFRPYCLGKRQTDPELTMSSFDAIYRAGDSPRASSPDVHTRESVTALLAQYESRQEERQHKMEEILRAGQPCALWGLTHMAMNLFADSPLFRSLPIHVITDSDPAKHGQRLHGIPVIPPQDLGSFTGDIIVLNNNSRESICESIARRDMHARVIIL